MASTWPVSRASLASSLVLNTWAPAVGWICSSIASRLVVPVGGADQVALRSAIEVAPAAAEPSIVMTACVVS